MNIPAPCMFRGYLEQETEVFIKKNTNELFNLASPGKLPVPVIGFSEVIFFFKVSNPSEEKLILEALGLVSVLTRRLSFSPSLTNCVSRTSSNGQRKHRHFKFLQSFKKLIYYCDVASPLPPLPGFWGLNSSHWPRSLGGGLLYPVKHLASPILKSFFFYF